MPPLILVHGGLDHSRSWDYLAQALRETFRCRGAGPSAGHGESEWASGSSYSLAGSRLRPGVLVKSAGFDKVTIGHSDGRHGQHDLRRAFPERGNGWSCFRCHQLLPHERSSWWTSGIVPNGSAILTAWRATENPPLWVGGRWRRAGPGCNPRLTREQAVHLATHGLKRNEDGTYSWKFDPYLRARAPYRLSLEVTMWVAVVTHGVSDASVSGSGELFCPIRRRPACSRISKQAELVKILPVRATGCNTRQAG